MVDAAVRSMLRLFTGRTTGSADCAGSAGTTQTVRTDAAGRFAVQLEAGPSIAAGCVNLRIRPPAAYTVLTEVTNLRVAFTPPGQPIDTVRGTSLEQ